MPLKKTYYKINPSNEDGWWICTAADLKSGIADWVEDYKKITVTPKYLTSKEFNEMPEYQS